MPNITTPDEWASQIIRENRMDPKDYSVMKQDADSIRLLCHATRDIIVIWKGDRPW